MELALALRDELQALSADTSEWPGFLSRLTDLLDVNEAAFGGGHRWEQPTFHAPRTDPSLVGIYLETYHQQNAFMQAFRAKSMMRVVAGAELSEFEDLKKSDFYNLWCLPQGYEQIFGFTLASAGGWVGTMSLNIRGAPEAHHLNALASLMPQIQRVVDTQILFAEVRRNLHSALGAVGLTGTAAILLDRQGRVVELNGPAESLLRSGRLQLRDGRLGPHNVEGGEQLSRLIHECLNAPDFGGGRVQLQCSDGDLTIRCAPFSGSQLYPVPQRPAVIVIIHDPLLELRQRLDDLRRTYALTQAEIELAVAVYRTGNRKDAAALRGVTDATARAQLSSIFDKTGVRRQTELIRLLTGRD